MKFERLSSLAELVSSIAILATLIYLTIEVHQNTESQNAQSRQSVLTSSQAELFFMAEHPEIEAAIFKPGPLTVDENLQLDSLLGAVLRSREFSWLQYQRGLIDASQWDTERAVVISVLDNERVRLWWTRSGRFVVGQEFQSFVDAIIADNPVTDSWSKLQNWSDP